MNECECLNKIRPIEEANEVTVIFKFNQDFSRLETYNYANDVLNDLKASRHLSLYNCWFYLAIVIFSLDQFVRSCRAAHFVSSFTRLWTLFCE